MSRRTSPRPARAAGQSVVALPRGRSILVLHADEELGDRLRRLVHAQSQIRFVTSWGALEEEARSSSPATVIVVDPCFGGDLHAPADALRELLARYPSLTVLATVGQDQGCSADVVTLARWGVVDVIDLDEESGEQVLIRRIRKARARPLTALFQSETSGPMSGRARAILETAVEIALEQGGAGDLARRMEMDGSTLRRWCAASGLPSPRSLLGWIRALQAGMLLDDPAHTVLSVALACGYGSDQALRRVLRRAVPLNPGELRERGAFETLRAAFLEEVMPASTSADGSI